MTDKDPYQAWLSKRRAIDASAGFSARVMRRILLAESAQREPKVASKILQSWLKWVSARPLIQSALVIAGVLLGVARFAAIFQVILSF